MNRYLLLLLATLICCGNTTAQLHRFSYSREKMGSPFNIIFFGSDTAAANRLAENCYALVDSLNLVFSDYDTASELSRLSRSAGTGKAVKLSTGLWRLLRVAQDASRKSKGAFDITVGPLTGVWRQARRSGRFPSKQRIDSAKALTGFDAIRLDSAAQTALLLRKNMRLDAGGIAKGYIAQQVIDYLSAGGTDRALVDAGGDMVMSGSPPQSSGWTIGVNIPGATETLLPDRLLLRHSAVASSGDVFQYMEHEGRKYSHIIDPRSGYGITTQRNVTVIATDGTTADWLATACSVLPVKQALKLAKKNHAEVLINELHNGQLVSHATASFWKYRKTL